MPQNPSPEEIRAWIHKHLASAPERDEAWYREVLNIYMRGGKPPSTEGVAQNRAA